MHSWTLLPCFSHDRISCIVCASLCAIGGGGEEEEGVRLTRELEEEEEEEKDTPLDEKNVTNLLQLHSHGLLQLHSLKPPLFAGLTNGHVVWSWLKHGQGIKGMETLNRSPPCTLVIQTW